MKIRQLGLLLTVFCIIFAICSGCMVNFGRLCNEAVTQKMVCNINDSSGDGFVVNAAATQATATLVNTEIKNIVHVATPGVDTRAEGYIRISEDETEILVAVDGSDGVEVEVVSKIEGLTIAENNQCGKNMQHLYIRKAEHEEIVLKISTPNVGEMITIITDEVDDLGGDCGDLDDIYDDD